MNYSIGVEKKMINVQREPEYQLIKWYDLMSAYGKGYPVFVRNCYSS